ncbi:MAG: UDP-N-acetylglucosamine 2-epimerase (non-hydrolyzing) [Chloroflexi bacterium]|nr:UDP-N-acetylglucosamine 2-epimerase (non-hydrolyzing) [Chloroflexota bacterium]
MKIISVVGARPQFIKCAALSKELRKLHHEVLIDTGQHYDYQLNKVFFDELGIPKADYHLGIGSGTHGFQTAEMMKGIEQVLSSENPELVLLYGDTNSTLAGALAAVKMQIRIAHVEAGLRGFNRSVPEEVNRVLTDHCSDLLFCPTQKAVDNLTREGIIDGVYLTGDVMVDTLADNREISEHSKILERLGLRKGSYLVVTIHRVSNTDDSTNLEQLVDALCELDETVVFPVHPRTKKVLRERALYDRLDKKMHLIEPLGYLDFLKLMSNAKRILTDSGGIQKEAYLLNVPCITFRDTTEWAETVEDGWNVLVGTNKELIIENGRFFNPQKERCDRFGHSVSMKIAAILDRDI